MSKQTKEMLLELLEQNKIETITGFNEESLDVDKESLREVLESDDYEIYTDEEANDLAKQEIKQSLWAFNPSFLACETNLPIEMFEGLQSNNKCEDNNEAIEKVINNTCGMDSFVNSATNCDGRGHFISHYDGEETEIKVNGVMYFVYRMN